MQGINKYGIYSMLILRIFNKIKTIWLQITLLIFLSSQLHDCPKLLKLILNIKLKLLIGS